MKRRADLLIDGKYRRITIWDALDWKQNRPDLWEKYKNNIYSICTKPENKVRMVFQTGKNGKLNNSYFRYYNADFENKGEGSEKSYRHEFFKECITEKYIEREYTIGGNHLLLTSEHTVNEIQQKARKVMGMLKRGVKFTPTQPDIMAILKKIREMQ